MGLVREWYCYWLGLEGSKEEKGGVQESQSGLCWGALSVIVRLAAMGLQWLGECRAWRS